MSVELVEEAGLDLVVVAACLCCYRLVLVVDLASAATVAVGSFVDLEDRWASADSDQMVQAEDAVEIREEVAAQDSPLAEGSPCRSQARHLGFQESHAGHQDPGSEVVVGWETVLGEGRGSQMVDVVEGTEEVDREIDLGSEVAAEELVGPAEEVVLTI